MKNAKVFAMRGSSLVMDFITSQSWPTLDSVREYVRNYDKGRRGFPHDISAYIIEIEDEHIIVMAREPIHPLCVNCPTCGLYMPGHATGGDDICTCDASQLPKA